MYSNGGPVDLINGNYIAVFTDGSSIIGKNKSYYEASSAYMIVINGEEVHQCQFYHDNGTNSIGEVYAMHQAIEKVEEIKRDNPELKDYFTFYVSDSQYVIKSINVYMKAWRKQGYEAVWKGSNGKDIAYQNIFKHINKKYFDHQSWYKTNMFIHIKGHLSEKRNHREYFKKFIDFNSLQMSYKRRFCYFDTFEELANYNTKVDELADEARLKKIFYKEKRLSDKWDIKENLLPKRNQRIIIRSRNASK